MLRAPFRFLLVVALIAACLPFKTTFAAKGLWVSGNEKLFAITQICRDGVEATAVVSQGVLDPDDTGRITLAARLWNAPWLPEPSNSTATPPLIEEYGPSLQPNSTIDLPFHAEPLVVDANGDSVVEEYNHYGSQIFSWSRQLRVGDNVIVHEGEEAYTTAEVENCFLNRLAVNEGGTATIDGGKLKDNEKITDAARLVYRVTSLPAHGTLRLNGAPLGVGGAFTQNDVNTNRLTYLHDGGESTSDSFGFSVSGTTRVSVRSDGAQGDDASSAPSIAYNGAVVAFQSTATNLVSGDTNGASDVFLRDVRNTTTTRASVAYNNAQANGGSFAPSLSSTGGVVAFESLATNLVDASGDCVVLGVTAARHIFQRIAGSNTVRASVSWERWGECYQANNDSFKPAVSRDGSFVAFASDATNLLRNKTGPGSPPGDGGLLDENNVRDVYGHSGNESARYSVPTGAMADAPSTVPDGASDAPSVAGPSVGPTNTVVAFTSLGSNLVAGDTNGFADVFVRDATGADKTVRVSSSTGGTQGNQASDTPSISYSGRFVAFRSRASNLVSDDTNTKHDIFVRDRNTNNDDSFDGAGDVRTSRISLSSGNAQGNEGSYDPSISVSGRYVAFESDATNLVSGDGNGVRDIFVRDRDADGDGVFDEAGGVTTVRVSAASNGAPSNGTSSNPSISADGSYVAFDSAASNLVGDDTNGKNDVFLHYVGFSSTFPIHIAPQNDAPTISPIGNQSASQGAVVGPLAFTLSDPDSNVAALTVTASSSNQALLPNSRLTLGGNGASRSLTISLAGVTVTSPTSVTITVSASDGTATGTASFRLTINPPGAPTISPIPNQSARPGSTLGPIAFTLADSDSNLNAITLTATSSNQTLAPNANISFGGSGANRSLTIVLPNVPVSGPTDVLITVTASDGSATGSIDFTLRVIPSAGADDVYVYLPAVSH